MAKNKQIEEKLTTPLSLKNHNFYGLLLEKEQEYFRDTIYDENNLIVFAEAPAGTGKTIVSVATGVIMCDYRMFNGIVYISASTQQQNVGFLPGTYDEKIVAYISPFFQALNLIGEKTRVEIDTAVPLKKKEGKFLIAMTPDFLRGQNICNSYVIIDEAQNMTKEQLKTIITRCDDSCKIVCIGSNLQIDLPNKKDSGFSACIEHFRGQNFAAYCELKINHRGRLSSWADRM